MAFLSEAAIEQALLDQLRFLHYTIEIEENIGPDGHRPERESHDEVVLQKRFEEAVARLNPQLASFSMTRCDSQVCSKTNVVQTKAFSERLEEAVARYHANAITTAEVLQELIELAKEIRAARQRGEESGLSDEEIAFYDALAENESAVQIMGDDKLKVIAHELLVSLRENVSVDWAHRDSARARMRVLVKRILRKYGYPPDLQDSAVQTVLQQAEALSAQWDVKVVSQTSKAVPTSGH
ncbi:MAG: type I restriction enzyme endonuclease domain-containing protein [Blastocatellia bacterium]|jgi:type I site-specific restriction-modification system R (restriction) subunit